MLEIGLKKIDSYLKTGKINWTTNELQKKTNPKMEVPEFITTYLSEHDPALTNFNNLPSSQKRNYILWISDAKKEETRKKRLKEAVNILKKNEKLGMK